MCACGGRRGVFSLFCTGALLLSEPGLLGPHAQHAHPSRGASERSGAEPSGAFGVAGLVLAVSNDEYLLRGSRVLQTAISSMYFWSSESGDPTTPRLRLQRYWQLPEGQLHTQTV